MIVIVPQYLSKDLLIINETTYPNKMKIKAYVPKLPYPINENIDYYKNIIGK